MFGQHQFQLSPQETPVNMFKFVVVCALVGLATAATYSPHGSAAGNSYYGGGSHSGGSSAEAHAEIKVLSSDVRHDGFDYALETTNGIHASARGDVHGNIHGDYYYTSPEGVPVKVSYVADENGYQPSSDLLPTPPPVPVAILKALDYIRSHPPKEESHGGFGKHF